ncbi:hypothetical protein CA54_22100 [Symmachiella macrocystis]|uniref:Uncharacterized protein n=1 Tax=Symmachiella macrocystis TaxID=2527985 RepID=A0A5C6BMX6_9PLAN|nr:hypothetical protein [Symmachiella macrocystis]TWU13375.1 hypothetical protein CA54_22100 [Symmachiella macrocystis]
MNIEEKMEVLETDFRDFQEAVQEKLITFEVNLRKLTWRFHEQFPHYGLEQRFFELEEQLYDKGVIAAAEDNEDYDGRPESKSLYEKFQVQQLRQALAAKEAELDQLRAKLDE